MDDPVKQEQEQQNNQDYLKELEELRKFKAEKDQEQRFNELTSNVKPLYEKFNGRTGHISRFVKEYEQQLNEIPSGELENYIQERAKKDSLFFEQSKPAITTSNIFKEPQKTIQPGIANPLNTKEEVESYFRKDVSGRYTTIRRK